MYQNKKGGKELKYFTATGVLFGLTALAVNLKKPHPASPSVAKPVGLGFFGYLRTKLNLDTGGGSWDSEKSQRATGAASKGHLWKPNQLPHQMNF